ncbi:hypothetical protein [Mechercharimyces sp. CAU 1602]|uniref:hypothetical protein n=1 Tax=Mechercharimyces sp. CAU 1602 TaxID=2973933 RepID=UPI0021635A15|nr:hypothetical protein [Mechercharimyces sp. CAU 1602]MCS1352174.1 hypothetical protein [Mechercharimyces sp. CAU 1602]
MAFADSLALYHMGWVALAYRAWGACMDWACTDHTSGASEGTPYVFEVGVVEAYKVDMDISWVPLLPALVGVALDKAVVFLSP